MPSTVERVFTSRQETRRYYDKISGFYDALSEHSEGPVRRGGVEMLAPKTGERVMELGCRTGHRVCDPASAAGFGGLVLGLDLSERGLSPRVRFACCDGLHLPCRAAAFDAVFMSFTPELFDTPEIPLVLRECRRVGPDGLPIEVYEWTHRHFPNLVDCRPVFVRRALQEAGFAIVQKRIVGMWVPVEIAEGVPQ